MAHKTLLKGRVLSFDGSPFEGEPTDCTKLDEAVVIEDGRVQAVGALDRLRAAHPDAEVTDYGKRLIMAGFVDPHVHYQEFFSQNI